jgi:putative colanic acid biosysnthesis UDP-glucose lipid carrier transferase
MQAFVDVDRLARPFDTSPSGATRARKITYDQQWLVFTMLLLALDLVAVWAGLTAAYVVRISSGLLQYSADPNEDLYHMVVLLSIPVWLGLLGLHGLYRRDNLLGGNLEYQQVLRACTSGIIGLIVVSLLWRDLFMVSRGWLILSWIFTTGLLGLGRLFMRRIGYAMRRHDWLTARVLIVGANDQGVAMARQWSQSPSSGMRVIGFVDDFKPAGTPVVDNLRVIGRPTSLGTLVEQTGAQEVVVVPNSVAWETFEELVTQANRASGYTVRLSPGFYEILTTGVAVTNKTFVPLFTINESRIVGSDAILKVVLDYGISAALALLSAPFVLLVSAIKWIKHSPILVTYHAIGQGGTPFHMYKFATGLGHDGTPDGSRQVTRFGRLLYRTGLDKVPQFFNVLAGKMSIVGPRPRVIGDHQCAPHELVNLNAVKPGVIGPWAVAEFWSSADETRDELYYVRNWTIWLDLQIVFQAAVTLVKYGRRPLRASDASGCL